MSQPAPKKAKYTTVQEACTRLRELSAEKAEEMTQMSVRALNHLIREIEGTPVLEGPMRVSRPYLHQDAIKEMLSNNGWEVVKETSEDREHSSGYSDTLYYWHLRPVPPKE